MKLLLDTHTFLWLIEGNARLSSHAQQSLSSSQNDRFLSVASIWELAIKSSNKRLALRDSLEDIIKIWTKPYKIDVLTIDTTHALAVENLPQFHRDPFDRMLIAQALVEGFTLVSADAKFAPYPVPILW